MLMMADFTEHVDGVLCRDWRTQMAENVFFLHTGHIMTPFTNLYNKAVGGTPYGRGLN